MKKAILLFLSGLLGNMSAFANVNWANNLSLQQKEQIAGAIKLLRNSKTLVIKPNKGAQFDTDILKVLESEGRIERGFTAQTVVCND